MIALKPVGFLEGDTGDGTRAAELRAMIRSQANVNEREILAYLRSAPLLFIAPEESYDLLEPAVEIAGGEIRTDGVWMWPLEYVHYIETYHFAVPEEFRRHMASRGWRPPGEDAVDIAAILKNLDTEEVLEPAGAQAEAKTK